MKTYGSRLQNHIESLVEVAVIVKIDNKFVLRRDNDDGYIQFVRGGIKENESAQDAVVREVKDESGLADIVSFEKINYEYSVFESFADVKGKSICYPFVVRIGSKETEESKLDVDEFADSQLIELKYEELISKLNELNIADHTVDIIKLLTAS